MAYTKFPLFQSHLDLAHSYWERLVRKGDRVIDATCGNGHDTLKLAQLALSESEGHVWGFDIQELALASTHALLQGSLAKPSLERVTLLQESHATFPKEIAHESIKLIVYNLGYLPGGDKKLTTRVASTAASLDQAQAIIQPGGAICITCYPGHPEGALEQQRLLGIVQEWPARTWSCSFHQWINRRQSPALLLIQKESEA